MRAFARADLRNILAVARREFIVRARTRTFLVSTAVLVLVALAVGFAPVVISYFNRESTHVAVYVGASDLHGDPVATLDALLNPADSGETGANNAPTFSVRQSTDLAADRELVRTGQLNAVLDVERGATGDVAFTVYTSEPSSSRTAAISRQAATSIAVADRLGRLGLDPASQTSLFVPPDLAFRSPDPTASSVVPDTLAQEVADLAVISALEMFLLLAIIMYGTWIAQSVVEEKSSRMMEIILAAATPMQVLAGKVLGVSGAALLQFGAVLAAVVAALLLQGQVAAIVLGDGQAGVPSGLTPELLIAFSVLFVLGFVLYAVLFAAIGSLVSRQEDVSQIVTPLTLAASAGYLVAVYTSIGTFDPNAPWVAALSWVPFLSPYMMLSRLGVGTAGVPEVALSVLILLITIVAATWIAGRVYAAGVLMYGQKPSIRGMWKAIREAS